MKKGHISLHSGGRKDHRNSLKRILKEKIKMLKRDTTLDEIARVQQIEALKKSVRKALSDSRYESLY